MKMTVGNMHPLRLARKRYHLTQEQLADKAAIGARTVWRAEHNLPIGPESRQRLCSYFNMTSKELGLVVDAKDNSDIGSQEISSPALLQLITQDIIVAAQKLGEQDMDEIRRQLLQQLVSGSAALIGLNQDAFIFSSHSILNHERVAFFEHEMSQQWNLYHTGGTVRAYYGLNVWLKEIENFAYGARGSSWYSHIYSLLGLTYQLEGSLFRDMMKYPQAHEAYKKASFVADELNDRELKASALARRGVTCIQQQQPLVALEHLGEALNIVNTLDLPSLTGYILQARSEACAMALREKESKSTLELAEHVLERKGIVEECSHCQLNTTSIVAQRGVNAVLLGENMNAITLIDEGLKKYDPTLVRGRARLMAQKAEAYYGLGLIDSCTDVANEALTLASSVGSGKTIARVRNLHTTLLQSPWRKENSVIQLGELLPK